MTMLIDTNLLVHAYNAGSPSHAQAKEVVKDALLGRTEACVAHQNLLEFFSVVTNPKRVAMPISAEEAFEHVVFFLKSARLTKIVPKEGTLANSFEAGRSAGLSRSEIFDAYLAATMLDNGVDTILTDNAQHFQKYPRLKVVNPLTRQP